MLKDLECLKVLPIVVLYTTSIRMSILTTENLNLEKACLVNLGFNDSICEAMVARNKSGYTAEEEIEVQKLVTSRIAYKSSILGIFPFILMLFVGSWSDRHRVRKPFMIMPIFGEIVMNLGCLSCVFFFRELPMEVAIFFEAVPVALTGTWLCSFVGIYSYVSEKSSLEKRTFQIGLTTMCVHISSNLGIILSGVLHRLIGFYGVYGLSTILCSIAIVYGSLFIEDVSHYNKKCSRVELLKDVFDFRNVLGTISVFFRRKSRKRTLALILIIAIIALKIGSHRGEQLVTYMFTRLKFTWDEVDFSTYNTYHFFITLGALFISVTILVKWMKLEDAVIGAITMPSAIVGCIACSIAPNTFYFYIATLPELLAGSIHMVKRSIMSKLVSADELGQIFSIAASAEALGNPIFGPIYSFVYYKTIHIFPGAFYILSACIHSIILLAFIWLYLLKVTDMVQRDQNIRKEEDINSSNEQEVTKMMVSHETSKI